VRSTGRCTALPENDNRKVNKKHLISSPANRTHRSAKSTSASAPGRCCCGTNPATTAPAAARDAASAASSGRRRRTYLATYEYDTRASCSSRSRSKTRSAVCRCLRGAARSSRSIPSINSPTASSTGAARGGFLRGGGIGDRTASRTVRRCTLYLSASARIDI
jgi:hypothetical protein